MIEECLAFALQAPTPSNMQNWHFMVVTDPSKRAALAELYRKGREIYLTLPIAVPNLIFEDPNVTPPKHELKPEPSISTLTWNGSRARHPVHCGSDG